MKLAIGAYAWHELPTVYLKPYGGTCLGCALGTGGACGRWTGLPSAARTTR